MEGLQLAGWRAGAIRPARRASRLHQLELAVDIVGEIACDLLEPGVRAALPPCAASRSSSRPVATSVGTTTAGAEQQQQRRQPQPAGRSGRKAGAVSCVARGSACGLAGWPPNAAADRPTRPSLNATQEIP